MSSSDEVPPYPRPTEIHSPPNLPKYHYPGPPVELESVYPPPEKALEPKPELPSRQRKPIWHNDNRIPYVLTTHIIPAANLREDPDDVLPETPNGSGGMSKEERKDMVQKTEARLREIRRNYEDGPRRRQEKVLWICLNRYVRTDASRKGGYTLFFAHANGFHKEAFEPTILAVLSSPETQSLVQEIWVWEAYNHGDSSLLNKGRLNSMIHTRSPRGHYLYIFLELNKLKFNVDFEMAFRDQVVPASLYVALGIASAGPLRLSTLSAITHPALYTSLFLIDPVIVYPTVDFYFTPNFLSLGAISRRASWKSREEARKGFLESPFFRAWDSRVLDLYVKAGLYLDPETNTYRLKTSPIQEAIVFNDSQMGGPEAWPMAGPSTPPRTSSNLFPVARASTSFPTQRPKSPSLISTSGFSLIGVEEADHSEYSFWTYNPSTPYKGFGSIGRRGAFYSTPTLNQFASYIPFPSSSTNAGVAQTNSSAGSSLKSLFPRLWDVLISSPTRNIISSSRSPIEEYTYTTPDDSSYIRRHSMFTSYSPGSPSPSPNRLAKGKGKAINSSYFGANDEGGSYDSWAWSEDDSFERFTRHSISSQYSYINYTDLPPLDGEEGELVDVDDEACFLPPEHFRYGGTTWRGGQGSFSRARVVTGIDILSMLPIEVALHVLEFLASGSSHIRASRTSYHHDTFSTSEECLSNVLICASVSKTWRQLSSDNAVWRTLFETRWGNADVGGGITKDSVAIERYLLNRKKSATGRDKDLPALPIGSPFPYDLLEGLALDYSRLYRDRLELDRRWAGSANIKYTSPTTGSVPDVDHIIPISPSSSLTPMYVGDHTPSSPSISSSSLSGSSSSSLTIMDPVDSRQYFPISLVPNTQTEYWDKWEPNVTKLSGHSDSVYCIELPHSRTFAADKIFVTGSRDRLIKMWSTRTGKCIGTWGRARTSAAPAALESETANQPDAGTGEGHAGSVLCLKFTWIEEEMESDVDTDESAGARGAASVIRKGIMFSGSSDCTIRVWDVRMVYTAPKDQSQEPEYKVDAHVRTILHGHSGGVLDLRIDDNWIVSCSKDTTIRVWNRRTLAAHRVLRGHEGPVNAVGMEDGRVVSASGDGKMILWDARSGERLRTFEGHDRGLACIEFSNGLIISGSNDWNIKIWSAYTGKCLRTLHGHDALVRALAFDPTREILVSASYDRSIRVWDVRDALLNGSLHEGSVNVNGSGIREDDKSLMRVFKNAHTSHIFDVKLDVGRIVSTSHDQKIVVADFSRGLQSAHLFL
ncbi:hypothetical protein D9757_000935 [Collybiopsis confluens]|uniref:WD40 repeat-like protein n=1 Tax=Collybiopsis confluens TaxID=2823264 RepID=A0A8H5MG60_9AGAR|nr:hypothetical protein D9757_000935 [Collybiopsis confluens]